MKLVIVMPYKPNGWTEVALSDQDGPFVFPTDMLDKVEIFALSTPLRCRVYCLGKEVKADYTTLLKIVDDGRVPVQIRRTLTQWLEDRPFDGESALSLLRNVATMTLRSLDA